jgi:hypothetical protein
MPGWLSSFFGGAGSAGDSTEADLPRRSSLSGRTEQTWRKLYSPGSLPEDRKTGADYYDNVSDKNKEPSMWEMILKSEEFKRKSFSDVDANKDCKIDQKELAAAVNNPAVDTAKLMKEADTNRDGVIDRQEYRKVVDKYFGAA